jgi:hypothetical protein
MKPIFRSRVLFNLVLVVAFTCCQFWFLVMSSSFQTEQVPIG